MQAKVLSSATQVLLRLEESGQTLEEFDQILGEKAIQLNRYFSQLYKSLEKSENFSRTMNNEDFINFLVEKFARSEPPFSLR